LIHILAFIVIVLVIGHVCQGGTGHGEWTGSGVGVINNRKQKNKEMQKEKDKKRGENRKEQRYVASNTANSQREI